MIGYNPSHLNKNETLLEAFHRVEAYLKANPQYQVYQSSAWYDADKSREYALNTIIVPEGSKVGAGDVVLFVNAYVAVITAVSETTFTVGSVTYVRGQDGVTPNIRINADVDNNVGVPSVSVTKSGTNASPIFDLSFHNIKGEVGQTGATGATGATPDLDMDANVDNKVGTPSVTVYKSGTVAKPRFYLEFHNLKGETGAPGPTGANGKDGSNGNATYLCYIPLTQNTAGISIAAITTFPGRPIIENDIIISTATSTFGAMAQITGVGETTVTVNFIGTLKSEGGGTTLNKYETTFSNITGNSTLVSHINRIVKNAKGRLQITDNLNYTYIIDWLSDNYIRIKRIKLLSSTLTFQTMDLFSTDGTLSNNYSVEIIPSGTNFTRVTSLSGTLKLIYFNDTEIT